MAKAQAAARFMTEVAPPQVVSIMRRGKVARSLDTIAEDDREHLAYGPDHHQAAAATANSSGFAAAWARRAPPQAQAARAGGFMRELSKHFSDAHGRGGGWESSHKGHARRRVVCAVQQQLRKNNGA